MNNYVDVGFSNFIETSKIIGVSRPDSSPIRRLIQKAKEEGKFIDYTQGKKTRSIIISTCGDNIVIIASAVQTATIINRIEKAKRALNVIEKEHGNDILEITTIE
jgi:extracellular matrix regulatory protein A